MKILVFTALIMTMVAGYVGPIIFGIEVAGALGGSVQIFPAIGTFWAGVFGVLAAIGALVPPIIAERQGWLDL